MSTCLLAHQLTVGNSFHPRPLASRKHRPASIHHPAWLHLAFCGASGCFFIGLCPAHALLGRL